MRVPVLFAVAVVLAGCGRGGGDDIEPIPPDTILPANVADLVGASAPSGEEELKERGYESTRTDGETAFWWNGRRGSCVRVVSANGRYQSVDPVVPTDCSSTAGKTAAAQSAPVGPPPDLVEMVGGRAGQAETGLQNLGYESTRTVGLTSYWWNQSTGVCARIVTTDGRYRTIETAEPTDCRG